MRKKKQPSPFRIEVTSKIRLPFTFENLQRFAIHLLRSLNFKKAHLSLLLVGDSEMKRWHQKLMGINETTDVLSISQMEERRDKDAPNPQNSIGDVIIGVAEAKRQARKAGCSAAEEIGRYLIHGVLHCVGYDDKKTKDRERMWTFQEYLLNRHKKILTPNP